jgi:hypothetical protein
MFLLLSIKQPRKPTNQGVGAEHRIAPTIYWVVESCSGYSLPEKLWIH